MPADGAGNDDRRGDPDRPGSGDAPSDAVDDPPDGGERSADADRHGSVDDGSSDHDEKYQVGGDPDRPWNDARVHDRGPDDPDAGPSGEAEHPLSEDPTAAAIGHRYGRIWNGVDGALVVALGVLVFLAFRIGGVPAAAGLVVVGYLAYAYLPTLTSRGVLVLETSRPPGSVREELTDHRSPLVAVEATVAERIETTDDGATAIEGSGLEGERLVYDAVPGDRGIEFETRSAGTVLARGTARVRPRPGGSRVEVDVERVARFRLGELLHLPVLGAYQRRLWRHLGYDVVRDDVSLRI